MLPDNLKNKLLRLPFAQKAAWFTGILCFLICGILITANHHGERQLIRQSSELFGHSLILQLAREASTPLVQNDRLSLQSLLKELLASPLIVGGAIYDVENHPLAEAGEIRQGRSLSASIAFQDSIAGYAVINLDTSPLQQQVNSHTQQLVALALALTLLAYLLSLLSARYISATLNDLRMLASIPIPQRHTKTGIAYKGDDEIQRLAQQIISGPIATSKINDSFPIRLLGNAIIALTTENENPELLLANSQQQLKTICKLYDGDIQINRSQGLCIRFAARSEDDDYLFRALCSGLLILQYLQQQKVSTISASLVLQADTVSPDSFEEKFEHLLEEQKLIDQAFELAMGHQHLVVEKYIYQQPGIKDKIKIKKSSDDNDVVVIEALQEPYNALLQKQLMNLTQQLNSHK